MPKPRIVIDAEPCVNIGCLDGTYRGSVCQDCHGRGWEWPDWAGFQLLWSVDHQMRWQVTLDALYGAQPKEAERAAD